MLEVKDLSVRFRTALGMAEAVNKVSFSLAGEETLVLAGETGSGKSVIAHAITGLLPDSAEVSGTADYGGSDLLSLDEKRLAGIRGKGIAMIFQNPALSLNPLRTCGGQIREALLRSGRSIAKKEAKDLVLGLLTRMGFEEPEAVYGSYPFQLSGGMNQRVMIAAACAFSPRVMIADEPTKGLDEWVKNQVIAELLKAKEEASSSLLLITHDLDTAASLSGRIAVLYAGTVTEVSRIGDFFEAPLHPYAKALLGSSPARGFKPIPGLSPALTDVPKGCPFHPRCTLADRICERERPALRQIGERRAACHKL